MATVDLEFDGVSIDTNASASVTIYEDAGADGSGSNTDPNGKSYDNSDTISLTDGTTSYTSADTFTGGSGNEYWLEYDLGQTDNTSIAEITHPATVIP